MLDKQIVPVNFAQGVDTKTDPKLVMAGKLTLLENGVFTQGKKIKKRNGYDALEDTTTDNTTLGVSQGLYSFNNELIRFTGGSVYTYAVNNAKWVNKGPAFSINVTSQPVIRNNYQQTICDSAYTDKHAVFVWQDSRGSVRCNVNDITSNAQLIPDLELRATAVAPKCITVGGYVLIFYSNGSNLYCRVFDPSLPTQMGAENSVGSDINATNHWLDVDVSGSFAVIAYRTTANKMQLKYISQSGIVASPTFGVPSPLLVNHNVANCLHVKVDSITKDVFLYWHESGVGIRYMTFYADWNTTKSGPTLIEAETVGHLPARIVSARYSSTSYRVFFELSSTSKSDNYTKKCKVSDVGTITESPTVFLRSVGIASKAEFYSGRVYVTLAHDSTLQSTYFMATDDGSIVAKIAPSIAEGLAAKPMVPRMTLNGTVFSFSLPQKTQVISENATIYTLTGVQRFDLDVNANSNFYAKKLGEDLHISGGFLSMYDSHSVVEHGFHLYPEGYTLSSTGGGSVPAGDHLYYAIYTWVDNKGQIHRSSPSTGVSITITGTKKVTITVPTLRLTAKKSPDRADCLIEIYRTTANGNVAYKVTSNSSPLYNNVNVDSVTFDDVLDDTAITSNEILYTTGGVLDNIAAPAAQIVELYKDRMVLGGLEDNLEVWYSKKFTAGEGVAFNDSFKFRVNPLGGKVSALKFMDDKLIIFKENLVFALSGDGPNDLGQGNTYSQPELLSSDVGCPYPNSTVLTPMGIMFKSYKGIYLLARNLQLSYIGADVEAYNSLTVMSADLLQDKNQVRFLTKDGSCLMYDYYFSQWSTFTNHSGIDADIWNGQYTYLRTNGTVFVENQTKYLDQNLEFKLRMATAWLKMAGVQGYQRVKRAAILGDLESPHILRMSIGYDYAQYYEDIYLFDPSGILDANIYGQDALYGDSSPYGGVGDNIYQFRAHLRKQKCEAIRFLFEDITSGTAGQAYSLSDLSLEVGIKRGLYKMPATKSL
jgi:hypothetical protein